MPVGETCAVDPHPAKPSDDLIIVPGEWLTGYWTFHWMLALLKLTGSLRTRSDA